jgi:predicted short-subunit dehydrogenase-like oxidoreductase (DUF2520 family)
VRWKLWWSSDPLVIHRLFSLKTEVAAQFQLHLNLHDFTDYSASPVGIAGAGRVAQALGRLLYAAGQPVAFVASRSLEQAGTAAAFIGPDVEAVSYSDLAQHAHRILIAVPDSALQSVASTLALESGIVLHTCGAQGPEALQALAQRGVFCGAFHPLQTISDPESGAASGADSLLGAAFAIAGDAPAVAWAEHIVHAANGRILRIASERRPLYHAAAVMASNYVTAMLSAAQTLLMAADVDPEEALQALGPLARTSLDNALREGPVAALTGPIERGDVSTIQAHLAALEHISGPIPLLYRAAGLETLDLARRKGLCAERAAATERMLEASLT